MPLTKTQERTLRLLVDLMGEADCTPGDIIAVLPEAWQERSRERKEHGDWEMKRPAKEG
jgi:hypothetical protein